MTYTGPSSRKYVSEILILPDDSEPCVKGNPHRLGLFAAWISYHVFQFSVRLLIARLIRLVYRH